jgi:hypothetical protein
MGLELKLLGTCVLAYFVWPVGLFCAPAPSAPYLYTEAPQYKTNPNHSGSRFPAGAKLHIVEQGSDKLLVPGFAASADASVSFDGRRILFAGKQNSSDPWQIWEMPVRGDTPRRVTSTPRDAVTPFYLPPGKVVYSVKTANGYQIELMPLEGGTPLRLTYGPGDHLVTGVLRDGRVLFEAPHGALGGGARDLFTVYSDGTGVETYRCDHTHDRRGARQLASGNLVFETTGGKLAYFTSPRAVEVPLELPSGEFSAPVAELPGGDWLVAYRRTPGVPFGLYRWRPGSGTPVNVAVFPGANAVQPVVVAARPTPRRHPTALGQRDGANLLCLNTYISKEKIPAGSAASVRVWTLSPQGRPILLGRSPVQPDGSFFVQTPGERPLRMELLDAQGNVIVGEKGWFWARQGEQRVCVGCHAGPERAPDNVAPQVLAHSPEPVKMLQPQEIGNGSVK